MTRTNVLSSLVLFFLAPGLFSQIEINWEQEKAVSIYLESSDSIITEELQVSLQGKSVAIFGDWTKQNHKLKFKPAIPFSPGLTYQIKSGRTLLGTFEITEENKFPTRVLKIYPDVDTVPENLLKMQIAFSGAMGEQLSEGFIWVTNAQGDTLEKVFLPLQPELWNAKRDLLTLWLDPGRIKRELGPNQVWGSPLKVNHSYIVKISADWKDQKGYPLQYPLEKKYQAKEAIRTKPDPDAWKIETPKVHSRDPLKIIFERPMDLILSQECISVHKDEVITGNKRLEAGHRTWLFVPDQDWREGLYRIIIESRLEDLAGNNLHHLFDSEIGDQNQELEDQVDYLLEFRIE